MPTVFDDLYQQLFNSQCTKEGEAFERISAALTSIVFPNGDVAHNQKLRGQFSQSLYQVDVLRDEFGAKVFGEAKDYTDRGEGGGKVGRPDLQKLGGALPDVGAARGVFYSATDYTREAKKYAAAAQSIVGIPIDLIHIRPSVESDVAGRVQKIVLHIHINVPDYNRAQWTPIFTRNGQATLDAIVAAKGVETMAQSIMLERFLDSAGAEKLSIHELTADGFNNNIDSDLAQGCFQLPDHYIEVEGQLVELSSLEYLVPFIKEMQTVEIVVEGEPKILIKAEDGTINKLVTDKQLREIQFDNEGNVVRK